MRQTPAARTTTPRIIATPTVGLVVVIVAIFGTVGLRAPSPAAPALSEARSPGSLVILPEERPLSAPALGGAGRGERGHSTTEGDGALPDEVTVFDREYPGIGNLDPDLLEALRAAATDAAADGVELSINSGWRSPEYQQELLRDAVRRYGSEEEAARWVAPADTSTHVSGDAVDIGSIEATAWLSEHGSRYGLCQVYANEPWHYELRPGAVDRGCPRMYPDRMHDPRVEQEGEPAP